MKTVWKYLRWIFPPYYLYLILLYTWRGIKFIFSKIWSVITWPVRKLFGKSKKRFKGDNKKGEAWATNHLKRRKEMGRRPYTMDDFYPVWGEKQDGRSFISAETIAAVGKPHGLSLEEMVFIMCNPLYEWHWVIHGWQELIDYYGAVDHKQHIPRPRGDRLEELVGSYEAMIVPK